MNNHAVLLGLPGLYQNWLLSALDTTAAMRTDGDHNFISYSDNIEWKLKMDTDLDTVPALVQKSTVINLWVSDENFVWYLYNFFEKTDGVGIVVDNLVRDLFLKAPGTIAFDGALKHLVDSYQLSAHQDATYLKNAAIENFYFMLIDQHGKFKVKTRYQCNNSINVEFRDFEDRARLISKLESMHGFNAAHFKHRYQQLVSRNHRYLSRQKNFVDKLDRGDKDFDILETAYVGWLLWNKSPDRLDWFNPEIRQSLIENNWKDICNFAKMFYNKRT